MEDRIDIDELFASLEGMPVDIYRKQKAFKNDIRAKAEKIKNLPVESWPKIQINWDVSKEGQKFCLDGVKKEEFEKHYPEGFYVFWICLDAFDDVLCHYSRRGEDELWNVGSQSKLAEMIVYLSEGHPISPPLAIPLKDSNEIALSGGHHRYAVAKAIGERTIPICVKADNKLEIERLLGVHCEEMEN